MGCPVQDQELDSMILVDPFQLRIFCDSVTVQSSCEVTQVTATAWTVPCPPVATSSIPWSTPVSTDPCGSTSLDTTSRTRA